MHARWLLGLAQLSLESLARARVRVCLCVTMLDLFICLGVVSLGDCVG